MLVLSFSSTMQLTAYAQVSDTKIGQTQLERATQTQQNLENTNQNKDKKPSEEELKKVDIVGSCTDPIGWIEDEKERKESYKVYFVPKNKYVSSSSKPDKDTANYVKILCSHTGRINYKDIFDNDKYKPVDSNIEPV
jgi:seryl-tRNA(Sec) selenium transferase